jgi:hypothetical protein
MSATSHNRSVTREVIQGHYFERLMDTREIVIQKVKRCRIRVVFYLF